MIFFIVFIVGLGLTPLQIWRGVKHIAHAWQRLDIGKPNDLDIMLLKHELLELTLIKTKGYNAQRAHLEADKEYPWEYKIKQKQRIGAMIEFWKISGNNSITYKFRGPGLEGVAYKTNKGEGLLNSDWNFSESEDMTDNEKDKVIFILQRKIPGDYPSHYVYMTH